MPPISISSFRLGTVRCSSGAASGNLLLRTQPRTGRIRPYVEGIVGFNDLSTDTTTSIKDPRAVDGPLACLYNSAFGVPCKDDVILSSSTNNLDDGTFSYGFGVGTQFELPDSRLSLDARVRYMRGGSADYLKKGSIQQTDGSFDKLSSRTDVITAQVGITFHF